MIGVLSDRSQDDIVREFFELFKTPWEFYRDGKQYDVLICNGCTPAPKTAATLTVIYCGQRVPLDDIEQIPSRSENQVGQRILLGGGIRLPIYRNSLTFEANGMLPDEKSGRPFAYVTTQGNQRSTVRVGYELFNEIAFLLSGGQHPANASIPAIEVHASVLRQLIVGHGLPLIEIPPVPEGYQFIACLTHDIDHALIRRHKFDHTMCGFVYRALAGSMLDAVRGRASVGTLVENWLAVLKLPLVHLGLANDMWSGFSAYTELEGDARSSFFVIPFTKRPGLQGERQAHRFRASKYGAADVAPQLRDLIAKGNEVGLHGIDAWNDSSKAREELEEVQRVTGRRPVGVRMHWLYFDAYSPAALEEAGVEYDSTVGYNEAVGYKAGTTQVYKPPPATKLLELPLHIMDTALFLPSRQNLSRNEARKVTDEIIDNAVRFGGVVTVNWHERSIAPERLWRDFYIDLLAQMRARGAWLTNASDTVRWFRKRRSATFDSTGSRSLQSAGTAEDYNDVPPLCVRVHGTQNCDTNRQGTDTLADTVVRA